MSHLGKHGKSPVSVMELCESLKISEKEFYTSFPSLVAVEKAYWGEKVEEVLESIKAGEEFESFSAKQRIQTFLFAFLEKSLEFRSLMFLRFSCGPLKKTRELELFEEHFVKFAADVIKHGEESGEVANRGKFTTLYPQGLYLVFRSVIDYNLKDESDQFEQTDAYVEKSSNLAFELIRTQAIDSAFDLAKFFLPKTKHSS